MEILIQNIQNAFSNPELVFSILVFSAVVLLIMGGVAMVSGGDPVQRRLQARVRKAAPGKAFARSQGSLRNITGGAKGGDSLRRMKKGASGADEQKQSRIHMKLVRAGYAGPNAVNIYFISRVVLALVLPVTAMTIIPLVAGSLPPGQLIGIVITLAAMGFYAPVYFTTLKIRNNQTSAREGFPDALDMLLVCVEAGLSLAAALNRVGAEIGQARPMLGGQFRQVAQEMQAGSSREQALRNLADRIGIDEVRSLVTLLLQSDALGTSIGQSLRVHAEEMRKSRLLRAEEQANKLPAKMAIPLVLFILPCLLSVIMTPVIIRVYRAFS